MSPWINPPAEAIALDCVARAARWLPIAVEDGSNLQARWEMMMAALEGGMCLQKALGGAHAMATPLGELHLHHGTLVGVLLPHILRFNKDHAVNSIKRIRLAAAIPDRQETHDWMREFVAAIGLPLTLGELGVDPDLLPDIAGKASRDHLGATNPRPAAAGDYLTLLKAAM